MQLIQIGQPLVATVQQFIEQMAARQSAEIEQLKQAALAREAAHKRRRAPVGSPAARRARCMPSVRTAASHNATR